MEKHSSDFDVLPSPEGTSTAKMSNVGAAINLGPYACRPVVMPHMSPPSDFEVMPGPGGQYPHAGQSSGKNPMPESHSAMPSKGASEDLAVLPTPSGQYPHASSRDSARDGGGMA